MAGIESDTAFVKNLCNWARLAPSALARAAGLTPTTILRPYNGMATTRLSQPTFEKLRSRFPDFPGWRRDPPDLPGLAGDRLDLVTSQKEELAYVRSVDISLGMGNPAVVQDYPDTQLVPFNLGFIRAITKASTDQLVIISGHGDSMEPTLLRNDMLLIDTSQRLPLVSDLIWAFHYAGGGMIKRLRRIREKDRDRFLIISDNAAVPEQTADIEDLHVIGKLIWVGRKM
jgi:phage repressor protein C with HTH and peptisase S24 domain